MRNIHLSSGMVCQPSDRWALFCMPVAASFRLSCTMHSPSTSLLQSTLLLAGASCMQSRNFADGQVCLSLAHVLQVGPSTYGSSQMRKGTR